MAVKSLVWNGEALTAAMRAAQIDGIDKTMSDCVVHAKQNHEWENQSTDLERAIQVTSYAKRVGSFTIGQWGTFDLNYALIHELGGTIVPKKAKFLAIPITANAKRAGGPRKMPGLHYGKTKGGQAVLLDKSGRVQFLLRKSVTIPARPYLRPAADRIYPQLARNIAAAFQKRTPNGAFRSAYSSEGDTNSE